jgi:hypothetical protein
LRRRRAEKQRVLTLPPRPLRICAGVVVDAIESFLWTNSTSRASANTDVIDLHAVEANARQAAEAPAVIARTLEQIKAAVA